MSTGNATGLSIDISSLGTNSFKGFLLVVVLSGVCCLLCSVVCSAGSAVSDSGSAKTAHNHVIDEMNTTDLIKFFFMYVLLKPYSA